MSALRKEEPFSTTDAASQKRAFAGPVTGERTDAVDEANIDTASRRPPQSVATPVADDTSDRAIDDTYDGEIVSTTIETSQTPSASRAPQAGTPLRPDQNPQVAAPRGGPNPTSQGDALRTQSPQSVSPKGNGSDTHLFDEEDLRDFRARWDQVQTSFVDEPRHAVELADALVGTLVKRIADQFAEERAKLETQSDRGESESTEDLRQNFKRYRAFFDRLLGF